LPVVLRLSFLLRQLYTLQPHLELLLSQLVGLLWLMPRFLHLLLSPLLLRGVERVTGRIIIGTVLIVLGVYLITALGR